MEKITKIILTALISFGTIAGASSISQSQNQTKDINVTTQMENQMTDTTQQSIITIEQARETALQKVSGTVKYEYIDEEYVFIIENQNTLSKVEVNKIYGHIEDVDTITYNNNITFDQAKSTALTKVDGTIAEVGIDHDEYEFSIMKDNVLYELEIDSYSGNIMKMEQETIVAKQVNVSLEEAKNIALKKVNGTIRNVEMDDEYKVFIEKDQVLYEIEIDCYTGQIKDIDHEKIK